MSSAIHFNLKLSFRDRCLIPLLCLASIEELPTTAAHVAQAKQLGGQERGLTEDLPGIFFLVKKM